MLARGAAAEKNPVSWRYFNLHRSEGIFFADALPEQGQRADLALDFCWFRVGSVKFVKI
jgi:hypothetical protein